MKTLARTALIAFGLIAGGAMAQAKDAELVTVTASGASEGAALEAARRLWVAEATTLYGSGDWNTAMRSKTDCAAQSDASGWSCTLTGLPLSAMLGK